MKLYNVVKTLLLMSKADGGVGIHTDTADWIAVELDTAADVICRQQRGEILVVSLAATKRDIARTYRKNITGNAAGVVRRLPLIVFRSAKSPAT